MSERGMQRKWRSLGRAISGGAAFGKAQTQSLSTIRIWVYVGIQMVCFGALAALVRSHQSVWALTFWLGSYIFTAIALHVSLLSRVPVVAKWSQRATAKFIYWGGSALIAVAAKFLGSDWVAHLFLVSPVNLPYAGTVAAALLAGALLSFVLFGTALVFELATIPALWAMEIGSRERLRRGMGLVLLCVISFCSAYASGSALLRMSSPSFRNILLANVAYEFDAAPATYCDLTTAERAEMQGVEMRPSLKAIFLASSQEKALLVRRPPALADDIVLNAVNAEEARKRQFKIERALVCFSK